MTPEILDDIARLMFLSIVDMARQPASEVFGFFDLATRGLSSGVSCICLNRWLLFT
jgi:hypothetical protein